MDIAILGSWLVLIMSLNANLFSKEIILTFKDVSLPRLYSVLFTYCELYHDVCFVIRRRPKFYVLELKGWRD